MTLWYVMRATGLVAFALLTITVAFGVAGSLRWERGRWTRTVTTIVHRNASLLAVAFLGVHVATAVLDTYVAIPLAATVVPGLSSYRPLWVAFGAVAIDLMVALVVSSFLRPRIGHRSWRMVHWLAYAAWPLALTHAIFSGTDTGKIWTTALYAVCGSLVLAAAAVRLVRNRRAVPVSAGRPRLANQRPGGPRLSTPSLTRSRS
jgi:DMSO/TMAO reductase YedYZ heme-binding membrane subunit